MVENKKTKVINFIAGPGAGKSTMAGELFGFMKRRQINCEYVQEYAKELVWSKRFAELDDQVAIFGEQWRRQYALLGQVDYIITDSPLLLSLHYGPINLKKLKREENSLFQLYFNNMIENAFHEFDNINFFVDRTGRTYLDVGRVHNSIESTDIDESLKLILTAYGISYTTVKNLDMVITQLDLWDVD